MGLNNVRNCALKGFVLLAMTGLACDNDEGGDEAAAETDGTGGDTGGTTAADEGPEPITTTLNTSTTLPPADGDSTSEGGDEESTAADDMDPDDGPGDTSTGGGADLSCESYCGIYMGACTDYNAYGNMQECMDHCGQWPLGAVEDTGGDSLGCRLYHATVASGSEPAVHCPHAGPNGDSVCAEEDAPDCQTYCETYMGNCTEDNGVYQDMDDCMTQCAPWYQGSVEDIAGNTVGCRTYHGGAPAFGDAEMHCPHAGPGGAGVCVFG